MGTYQNRQQHRTRHKAGGARRDRTADLLHAMQALSQLSYGPTRRRGKVHDLGNFVKEMNRLRISGGQQGSRPEQRCGAPLSRGRYDADQ
jgi:hypothetical protein